MSNHALRLAFPLLLFAPLVHAESAAAAGLYAPAESAAVARKEWAAMRAARAGGDRAAAVGHAARAHAAWPGQWVYAYGLASVAAAAGDVGRTMEGLRALSALGAAPDLSPDTTLVRFARERLAATGEFENLERAAARPGARHEVAFRFPEADSAFWPEGIAHDPKGDAFFLTGVREGRIVRVDRAGVLRPFARIAPAGWSALGVAVDTTRDRVWVGAAALPQAAGYVAADSGRGAIVAFDRASGREVARFDLPADPAGHVPGDVLVTPRGDIHVSDSGQPVLWRVRDDRLEIFATDPGFRSLQGQALSRDGTRLYVADYSHGLARVDLETRAVTWLRPPDGGSTLGIDGLAMNPGAGLIGVQNGIVPPRLVWIQVEERGATPHVLSVQPLGWDREQADEPTLVAVVHTKAMTRTVYVANSQWEKYDEAGRRRPGSRLRPPLVLVAPVLGDGAKPPEVSPTRSRPPGGSQR